MTQEHSEEIAETVHLESEGGLHLRMAAGLVRIAQEHTSRLVVEKEDLQASGESITSLLGLGAGKGTRLVLKAKGVDARQLMDRASMLLQPVAV